MPKSAPKLRDRIAHHEPILGSNWEKIGAKLVERHQDAIDLLEWMSHDMTAWLSRRDRFIAALATCPA